MYEAAARNLRTAERYLLAPPLPGNFGAADVAVCDISAKGARFKHHKPLETGRKAVLKLPMDGRPSPLSLEAVIIWTQADQETPGRFVSGARTYGTPEVVGTLLAQLKTSKRTNRIEELRSTDRFFIVPALAARFGDLTASIDDLSARGARIETARQLSIGESNLLRFSIPDTQQEVVVRGEVVWSTMKTKSTSRTTYCAGLLVGEKPELMRLAIGQLNETNRATLDTQSLRLKLKIMRARARQLAPNYPGLQASGIPAEQYLLIQGVREELRLNPEEAMHWYRRARIVINDPATRSAAPQIANHPDALAVWEYLDRSIDPSLVSRAFELPESRS